MAGVGLLRRLALRTLAQQGPWRLCLARGGGEWRGGIVAVLRGAASSSTSSKSEGGEGSSKGGGDGTQADFDEEADREERRARLARRTQQGGIVSLVSLVAGAAFAFGYYGSPPTDEEGRWVEDEFSGDMVLVAYYKRCKKQANATYAMVVEPSREKLLPDPAKPPYYQPPLTLVVELKGVLVHPEWSYSSGWRFKVRPGAEYFLRACGYPQFELVVFTAENGFTAAPIIEQLNKGEGRIFYSLFRDTTLYRNGHHIKDLSRLNRPLEKVILVDHDPGAFSLQPDNALRIPKWDGNMDDTALIDLAKLLTMLRESGAADVRPSVQAYSQFDDPLGEFRRRSAALNTDPVAKAAQAPTPASRFAGVGFGFRRHT